MSLKIRFRFDRRCTRHPRYDPKRDGHPLMGSVKDASLFTSFTSTQRSPKEELKTRTSSWFGRPPIVKNDKSMMSSQALKLETNHEFSTDHSPLSCRRLVATLGALGLLE